MITKGSTHLQSQQTFNPFEVNISSVTSYTDDSEDTLSHHNVLKESLGVPKPLSFSKANTLRNQMSLSELWLLLLEFNNTSLFNLSNSCWSIPRWAHLHKEAHWYHHDDVALNWVYPIRNISVHIMDEITESCDDSSKCTTHSENHANEKKSITVQLLDLNYSDYLIKSHEK